MWEAKSGVTQVLLQGEVLFCIQVYKFYLQNPKDLPFHDSKSQAHLLKTSMGRKGLGCKYSTFPEGTLQQGSKALLHQHRRKPPGTFTAG